jgi:vacuolar-type H+-ATPase subunit I/STV1
MRKVIGLYLIVSFIAIAIFGFAGLLDRSIFSECARTLTNTMPCDPGHIISHAEVYQAFSEAALVLAMLLGFFMLCFGIAVTLVKFINYKLPYNLEHSFSSSQEKISKWFNILEHAEPRLNF